MITEKAFSTNMYGHFSNSSTTFSANMYGHFSYFSIMNIHYHHRVKTHHNALSILIVMITEKAFSTNMYGHFTYSSMAFLASMCGHFSCISIMKRYVTA